MCIHFSLQHGFDKALGEGTYGLGEGFGTQGAARCSKLGNVLFDVVIEGLVDFLRELRLVFVLIGCAHAKQTKRARSQSNRLFWTVVSGSHS